LDDPDVQRVWSQSMWQPSPETVTRVVDRCRSKEDRQLRGIVDGSRILGVAEYEIRGSGILYIANIAVAEDCRRAGIGREMIHELLDRYHLPIELETDDDAVGFYRKCGFTAAELVKNGVKRWKCRLEENENAVVGVVRN